jgi:hypothetical protein
LTKEPVSVLVTWDIDPFRDVSIENKKEALKKARWLLHKLQIQSTFFFHGSICEQLDGEIKGLVQDNHEIGCHGLTHGDEEEYNRMPEEMQRKYLCEATDILRRITGRNVSCFRGPRMKTSHITQKILVELGYIVDCSVASQRVDFVSSNLVNLNWIFAPRLPYRPSNKSAFRRGQQNLWVVPLSALILPFISSALYIFKVRVMKSLFKTLFMESQRTGKPIVYLIHAFEFAPSTLRHEPEKLSFVQEIRTHGFLVRERFFEKDHYERFRMNLELFRYIKSFPNVQFKTVGDFVSNTLKG